MKLDLPVIILKHNVLLPESELKFEFEDELSKSIIDTAEFFHSNKIFVITNIMPKEGLVFNSLPHMGVIAKITRKLQLPNGKVRVTLKGLRRARVIEYLNPSKDIIESIVSEYEKKHIDDEVNNRIIKKLFSELDSYISEVSTMSNSFISLISELDDLDKITDIIASNLSLELEELLKYLNELDPIERAEMLLEEMYKEEQLSNIEKNIDIKVKKILDNEQKNFYLKEKINLFKKELGEVSTKEEELIRLRESVKELNANSNIKDKISHEIDKYENMPSISPEISIVRNYIDLMLNLPWNNKTKDIENLHTIQKKLDKYHFGLESVKTRIIEYLAVKKQSENITAPIICLVGPPGVGKTTFANSVAQSINRKFVKVSLGGVDDEAIIKGHIRTYIGATCGKIIDGIKRAESSNPVFLLDEIDKLSTNYKGDPASALLEVLDSNQNNYFKDNYLEEEYDLSDVLFITTANNIEDVPEALRDRLEIINIEGYTEIEKVEITKNYLIPKICKSHGIKNIKIDDDELLNLIRFYTKELGLRELERMISKIVRKIITDKVIDNKKISLTINNVEKYLGPRKYKVQNLDSEIGLVNGLAYTNYGGDIIKIESNHYKGNGNMILTGSVGDIILESTKIALSYIKSNYEKFDIDYNIFSEDIHINIPNIAMKKDGPSAGVAITTCLISMFSNLNIKNNVAFTGEITLRGAILGVGGLREKIMGAYINNIDTIFIPYDNISDLISIHPLIKEKINIIPVNNYEQVYEYLKNNKSVA